MGPRGRNAMPLEPITKHPTIRGWHCRVCVSGERDFQGCFELGKDAHKPRNCLHLDSMVTDWQALYEPSEIREYKPSEKRCCPKCGEYPMLTFLTYDNTLHPPLGTIIRIYYCQKCKDAYSE